VTGKMQDGVVQWNVPTAKLGANAGSIIEDLDGADVTFGGAGALTGLLVFDSASMDGAYTVGPTVGLSLRNAAGKQVAAGAGSISDPATGAFGGSVSLAGLAPGSYTLVATACNGLSQNGNGNCGSASVPVTA